MSHQRHLLAVFFIISLSSFYSCKPEKVLVKTDYSFFVAGHVYGKPGGTQIGFYPPFKEQYSLIQNWPEMSFGVLTGDVTRHATDEEWDAVGHDIDSLGVPVHIAVGNHDHLHIENFTERYGSTWYSFKNKNDLFIVLDPFPDGWIIQGDQMAFLTTTVEENPGVDKIFILFHYALWWTPDNMFTDVYFNSAWNGNAERDSSANFWTEIEPMFRGLPQEVFFFAGDMGAAANKPGFMYHKYENITLIGSGMGAGTQDNFVIVSIMDDGSVNYKLVALGQSNTDAWGKLEDWTLP